jgi:hypothetical protein
MHRGKMSQVFVHQIFFHPFVISIAFLISEVATFLPDNSANDSLPHDLRQE